MKKVLIFAGILIFLFGAFAYINNVSNKKAIEGNPFNKTELHPMTIKQLDNPHYQNQILPEELDRLIEQKEDGFVFFYMSDCQHCQVTTPVVVPLAKELGIDLKMHNLLEFPEGWDKYEVEGVPHIAYYKDGQKIDPLEGAIPEEHKQVFIDWVNKHKSH